MKRAVAFSCLLALWILIPSDATAQTVLRVPDCRLSLFERANLASERTGIIDRVKVREGDEVAANQIVAELRNNTIQAALATAEMQANNDIDLRFARKATDLAALEYAKSMKVNESAAGTVPEIELRRLRLAVDKSMLQVEQAEHLLDVLRLQCEEKRALLNTCKIAAPWSGVVIRVLKRPGEGLREGEAVVEIADLSRLRAEVYVPHADTWRLQVGQDVRLQLDAPDESEEKPRAFPGKVVFIEPRVDPVTQKVRVWAEIQNEDRLLKDGLQGVLFIRVSNTDGTLPADVPKAARATSSSMR